jgi:hypothetical protein
MAGLRPSKAQALGRSSETPGKTGEPSGFRCMPNPNGDQRHDQQPAENVTRVEEPDNRGHDDKREPDTEGKHT